MVYKWYILPILWLYATYHLFKGIRKQPLRWPWSPVSKVFVYPPVKDHVSHFQGVLKTISSQDGIGDRSLGDSQADMFEHVLKVALAEIEMVQVWRGVFRLALKLQCRKNTWKQSHVKSLCIFWFAQSDPIDKPFHMESAGVNNYSSRRRKEFETFQAPL